MTQKPPAVDEAGTVGAAGNALEVGALHWAVSEEATPPTPAVRIRFSQMRR